MYVSLTTVKVVAGMPLKATLPCVDEVIALLLVETLAPIQARINELEADKSYTLEVLRVGAERAEAIAARTLAKVRERIGLVPRP